MSDPVVSPDVSAEPGTPPTSAADGRRSFRPQGLRTVGRAVGLWAVKLVATFACCVLAFSLVILPYAQEWQNQEIARVEQAQAVERLAQEKAHALFLEAMRDEIKTLDETFTPPSNDKLFTILSKGVALTEYAVKTTTVGTTPTSAFTTDLTSTPVNQQTDAFTQEFTVRNLDASTPGQDLCWKPIAWASAGANCAAKCAAAVATITCTGAATDGGLLTSGQSISRRFDGTSCVCVVADTAGTAFQTERIVR